MASDIFLKLSDIDGESQDDIHPREFDILSWRWGMRQPGPAYSGRRSRVTINNVVCVKKVDLSSPTLMGACCRGTVLPEGILTCRKAGDKVVEYYVLRLKEVFIAGISAGIARETEEQTEEIELNFQEFRVTYTAQSATGQPMGSNEFEWSIADNEE